VRGDDEEGMNGIGSKSLEHLRAARDGRATSEYVRTLRSHNPFPLFVERGYVRWDAPLGRYVTTEAGEKVLGVSAPSGG
jgi:hypothetical protein